VTLDAFLRLGETVTLGTHPFEADEIKAFARLYDPQPFHVDEAQAAQSLFGKLCASGWHTAAMWMKLNVSDLERHADRPWEGAGPRPEWGPSPGFQKLRWPKPVYAGESVTFTRTALNHRRTATRPGWRMLQLRCGATDSSGDTVLDFESAVMVKAA
jgi:acyl dehydratase